MNRKIILGLLLFGSVVSGCAQRGGVATRAEEHPDFARVRADALRGTRGTYGRAPRLANGRMDLQKLLAELVDIHANAYGMVIHNHSNDWDDLQTFLPLARKQGIRVWATVMPPSESPPHQPLYSEPFRMDYNRWAEELARLGLRETNFVAWAVDDFNLNLKFFTPERVEEMLNAARAVNPRLAFAPTCYYKNITPTFIKNYGRFLDALKFPYRHESGGANLTDATLVEAEVKHIKELAGANFPVVLVPYATAHSKLGKSTPEYVEQVMRNGKASSDGVMVYCHQDPKQFPEKYQIIKKLFAEQESAIKPATGR